MSEEVKDSEFVVSMAIYKNPDETYKALIQYGDDHPEWVDILKEDTPAPGYTMYYFKVVGRRRNEND